LHLQVIEHLRCLRAGQRLALEQPEHHGDRIRSGWLVSEDKQHRYPIRDFIPRFVPESNYADNFGMQWNEFRRTQLDSYSGHPITFDWFSPEFDNPQTPKTAARWLRDAALEYMEVLNAGHLVGRGTAPHAPRN